MTELSGDGDGDGDSPLKSGRGRRRTDSASSPAASWSNYLPAKGRGSALRRIWEWREAEVKSLRERIQPALSGWLSRRSLTGELLLPRDGRMTDLASMLDVVKESE